MKSPASEEETSRRDAENAEKRAEKKPAGIAEADDSCRGAPPRIRSERGGFRPVLRGTLLPLRLPCILSDVAILAKSEALATQGSSLPAVAPGAKEGVQNSGTGN